jgi:hypothetical protein
VTPLSIEEIRTRMARTRGAILTRNASPQFEQLSLGHPAGKLASIVAFSNLTIQWASPGQSVSYTFLDQGSNNGLTVLVSPSRVDTIIDVQMRGTGAGGAYTGTVGIYAFTTPGQDLGLMGQPAQGHLLIEVPASTLKTEVDIRLDAVMIFYGLSVISGA